MTFDIKFYQDNAGNPGTEVASFTKTISRIATGETIAGYDIYNYHTELGSAVSLSEGWVSIEGVSTGAPSDCWFLWLETSNGTVNAKQFDGTTLNILGHPLSLCLGKYIPPSIPLAPWAIILGIGLIGGFLIIRNRKKTKTA
jgi:hypothetical protein